MLAPQCPSRAPQSCQCMYRLQLVFTSFKHVLKSENEKEIETKQCVQVAPTLLLLSPRAQMINSMFVEVRLSVVEVVGIRGICGKGCRITSCPCALFPNEQLSESCKSPCLWQRSNPHLGRQVSLQP